MTRLIICFSLFIFCINAFHAQGNNEAFNDQLAKAEKATALNKSYRDYLNKTEAKMKALR